MSLPDLPLDELRSYQPRLASPADSARFWAGTLADAAGFPVAATFERVATGLRLVDTFDVCFAGYGGHPIRGWLHLPAARPASQPAGPLPMMTTFSTATDGILPRWSTAAKWFENPRRR